MLVTCGWSCILSAQDAALTNLELQHDALALVRAEREELARKQINVWHTHHRCTLCCAETRARAQVHPLLRVAANAARDPRDAFVPHEGHAAMATVPGVETDEAGADLERSLLQARARIRVCVCFLSLFVH